MQVTLTVGSAYGADGEVLKGDNNNEVRSKVSSVITQD